MTLSFNFIDDTVQWVYGTATTLCIINLDFDTGMLFCCFLCYGLYALVHVVSFRKRGGTEVLCSSLSFGPSSLIIFNIVSVIVIFDMMLQRVCRIFQDTLPIMAWLFQTEAMQSQQVTAYNAVVVQAVASNSLASLNIPQTYTTFFFEFVISLFGWRLS